MDEKGKVVLPDIENQITKREVIYLTIFLNLCIFLVI